MSSVSHVCDIAAVSCIERTDTLSNRSRRKKGKEFVVRTWKGDDNVIGRSIVNDGLMWALTLVKGFFKITLMVAEKDKRTPMSKKEMEARKKCRVGSRGDDDERDDDERAVSGWRSSATLIIGNENHSTIFKCLSGMCTGSKCEIEAK